ncbi:hypothetical protein AMATHDRAFT_50427 [Amanita thiersii Skay4041]|uniref:Uncharacterized protein n=1 Tax=Amanita thiersii Skay4041 TaxID=703135 RepID=A0A2A9NG75_9AGAR|nr:hypothetical protein AMATHDRAFT_50427 [Amanita thiersii Skay4041]
MSMLSPPQRPPSRSQCLLRETLRRDEELRDTVKSPSSRRTSVSRRRSSVSSPPMLSHPSFSGDSSRPSSPHPPYRYAELADEQYTRGAFLFRSAMTNAPNSPQPLHSITQSAKMDSLVESPVPVSPRRDFRGSQTESSEGTMTPSNRKRYRYSNAPHSPTPSRSQTRQTSPSPSRTEGAIMRRRQSLQRSPRSESVLWSPQEHALRSRLEYMLQVHEDTRPLAPPAATSKPERPRRGRSIEVQDETGACPWCDRGSGADKSLTRSGSISGSGASILSTPPRSSTSLHSHSSSSLQEHCNRTHNRSRSHTDPFAASSHTYSHTHAYSTHTCTHATTSPSMSNFLPKNPTSSSAHSPVSPYHYHLYAHQLQQQHVEPKRRQLPIEATPPLTADASPTGINDGNELEPEFPLDRDDDARLITPPPTPPSSHHSHDRKTLASLGDPHASLHPPHSPSPYRPVGNWYSSFGGPDDDAHPDAEELPRVRSLPTRPQFNVRKASEQCKRVEGYVSFLDVEGLGGPPGSDSPAIGDGDMDGGNSRDGREKKIFSIGWNGWKKLLPLGGGGGAVQER